jgi:hypothetical protein
MAHSQKIKNNRESLDFKATVVGTGIFRVSMQLPIKFQAFNIEPWNEMPVSNMALTGQDFGKVPCLLETEN